MTQVQPINSLKPETFTLNLHESVLEGKINSIETPQNSEYTYFEIGCKAQDEYSLPPTLQVSQPANQRPFGRVGDVVRIKVKNSGFPRTNNGRRYITNVHTFLETL